MNQLAEFVVNKLYRSMAFLNGFYNNGSDTKHDRLYCDYGYPTEITFDMCYQMWERNGYATAGINHAVETCWQTSPQVVEKEETHDTTIFEKGISEEFERLKLWQILAEADLMSRVGEYAGVIFRYRDGLTFNQPVGTIPKNLGAIAEIIPAWQGQLSVSLRDTDQTSQNYGAVTMYQFNETSVDGDNSKARQFDVHPSRVHIWSKNQSVYGNRSVLKAGFNNLIDIQKIIGGGAEGFWKIAKQSPVMNVDKETKPDKLAKMLGVTEAQIADRMDEIVKDFNTGLDSTMMFQGIEVKTLPMSLPIPDKFVLVAAQSFAASINEPLKLLVGNQNGERASTEDNKQWNKTCSSRRNNYCKPNIMAILEKWKSFGIIENKPYYLLWGDLTESTTDEKMTIADKMATVNQKALGTGDPIFTIDEIRETAGWKAAVAPTIPKRDPTIDKPPKS